MSLNSMFQWYRNAQVCYAFLSDVPSNDDAHHKDSHFRKCRWFTRGWTLQELVAPLHVTFFGADWKEIGTKSSLRDVISDITGMPSNVLLFNHPGEISVAQRMSWAAGRKTSRVEDQAYCLLGLFGVSMPTIYGEGENAFIRLQLEIMKTSDDQSIFAWAAEDGQMRRGLLATSPSNFAHCRECWRSTNNPEVSAFAMTNSGLHITLPLFSPSGAEENLFVGLLNCQMDTNPHLLGIYLQRSGNPNKYTRVKTNDVWNGQPGHYEQTEIYISEPDRSRFDVNDWFQREPKYVFRIQNRFQESPHTVPGHEDCVQMHTDGTGTYVNFIGSGHSAVLVLKNSKKQAIAVVMGMHNWNVWCDIKTNVGGMEFNSIAREFWDGNWARNRWDSLDRKSAELANGGIAFVAIRKGILEGQRVYWVDINAEDFRMDQVGRGCHF